MEGQVHQHQVLVSFLQASDSGSTAVRAAVVEHPEDAASGAIRLFGHDLVHKATERLDASRRLQELRSETWCKSGAALTKAATVWFQVSASTHHMEDHNDGQPEDDTTRPA